MSIEEQGARADVSRGCLFAMALSALAWVGVSALVIELVVGRQRFWDWVAGVVW